MKKTSAVLLINMITLFLIAGCDSIRIAPNQIQKQNAWLHCRTTRLAADLAKTENTSNELKQLASLSSAQSEAFLVDYGMPKKISSAQSIESVLAQETWDIANAALKSSAGQQTGWDLADTALDTGIVIAGLFGGVYGVKIAGLLRKTRDKSKALREIILGNETLKKQGDMIADTFKKAQKNQSKTTRQIVSQIKQA